MVDNDAQDILGTRSFQERKCRISSGEALKEQAGVYSEMINPLLCI